ncbi:MAG: sulfotransferase [Cyanobacteria bacterium P01_F01_bin.33]
MNFSRNLISTSGSGRPDVGSRLWRFPTREATLAISDHRVLFRNAIINLRLGVSARSHLFIVGMSRSGTSLLATRVAAHPLIATLKGETFFFLKRNFSRLDVSHVNVPEYRSLFLNSVSQTELFDKLADTAISMKFGAKTFLEKTPDHVFALRSLLKAYPNARFAVCIRDPRDAYVSWQRHPHLRKVKPVQFGRYCARFFRAFANIRSERIIIVRYEDLCNNPIRELTRVAEFFSLSELRPDFDYSEVGSDWAYLESGGHDRIKASINPMTVGVWRTELPKKAALEIRRIVGQAIAEWNYD